MDPSPGEQLIEQLRLEIAARPMRDVHRCPSWPRYVHWLRSLGQQDDVADAIELALEPPRARNDRQERFYATRRVITRIGGPGPSTLMRLWAGELAWSWWFGPFMLAFVDTDPPLVERLPALLGPLAMFLSPARTLDANTATDWLLEQAPHTAQWIPSSLPGQRQALEALFTTANTALHGQLAVAQRELAWVHVNDFITHYDPPPTPAGEHAVVSYDSLPARSHLHWPTLRRLRSAVVITHPEAHRELTPLESTVNHWPEPLATFETRHRDLAEAQPGLFASLHEELASRTLAEAPHCPSWPVFIDFLLEQGHPLLAQWLHAAIENPAQAEDIGHELTRGLFSGPRKHRRYALHQLWKQRGSHAHWLGPYVLRYFDPRLEAQRGALEVQTLLGVHASFLPRERIHTEINQNWLRHALKPAPVPTLAPLPGPHASTAVGKLLSSRIQHPELADTVRVAGPGETLTIRHHRELMTNTGPVARDSEASAVLCCESIEDIRRHAAARTRLDDFVHVILLGTQELLAQWPHRAQWLPPWSNPEPGEENDRV